MSLKTEIFKKLRSHGFKNTKDPNDKRLGLEMSLISEDESKYIEIYFERKSYYQIFLYGFSERYLPLSVDVLGMDDLPDLETALNFKY